MQHWIAHQAGKAKRGDGAPPEGVDLHFVDEAGSMAVVSGVLYLNGHPAGEGEYPLRLAGEAAGEVIAVDKHGKARRTKGGGNGNGNGGGNHRPGTA